MDLQQHRWDMRHVPSVLAPSKARGNHVRFTNRRTYHPYRVVLGDDPVQALRRQGDLTFILDGLLPRKLIGSKRLNPVIRLCDLLAPKRPFRGALVHRKHDPHIAAPQRLRKSRWVVHAAKARV